MGRRYTFSPAARIDLAEIADFIRRDSPDASRRVVKSLREAVEKLAKAPGLGHVREDLAQRSLRFWPVYSYLIIYRAESRPLEVVRILHGARDVRRILKDD